MTPTFLTVIAVAFVGMCAALYIAINLINSDGDEENDNE